ncbi:MAG TPA: ATP-binding cassette domain-containing protein [Solirubrobacteraceae bacterium]|jgi:ABC-type lipoprotein export system ATPase subunit|nr:ATP-binding cassette domain-containing protein [Solirubrobacteraceae bacterium]
MADVLLSLDAVSKSYWRGPSELRVLTDASLDVAAGELVAVWGKRGAGKTTLLRIAAGLEAPDRGSVRFDGADLARLSESAHARLMREQVGWVRRSGPSSDLAMLDYVALPLLIDHGQRGAHGRASEALRRVGMSDCAGQRWSSLSDGERALVAIAHGMARTPRLLLVDDPTANLGLREREEVLQLLLSLVEEANLAVLMAVPDMPAAMRSHQLRALSGGRLLTPAAPPAPRGGNILDFPRSERSA